MLKFFYTYVCVCVCVFFLSLIHFIKVFNRVFKNYFYQDIQMVISFEINDNRTN